MTTFKSGIISPKDLKDFCFYRCKLCGIIQLMYGGLQKHGHEHVVVEYVEPEVVK